MAETAAIYTNKAAPKTTTNLETRRKRERERERERDLFKKFF